MPILDDIVNADIELLICGYSVGKKSSREKRYFSHPGNRFWRILHETGLTDRLLSPYMQRNLLDYGIGVTDLIKEAVDKEEPPVSESDRARLRNVVEANNPRILAFLGAKPVKDFLGRDTDWGNTGVRIDETIIWKLPDPSGGNGHFTRLKNHWHEVAIALQKTHGRNPDWD